jgi:hypothetical protein
MRKPSPWCIFALAAVPFLRTPAPSTPQSAPNNPFTHDLACSVRMRHPPERSFLYEDTPLAMGAGGDRSAEAYFRISQRED